MRKYLSILIIAIALVFISPITASAASANVKVVDDAGILSEVDEELLVDYLEGLDPSVNYLAVTCEESPYGYTALEKLDGYYKALFDEYQDGIAFIIDMDTRRIEMQGRNNYKNRLTSGDCTDITDNVYTYASKEDYYTCIYQAFRQADMVANYKTILRPMRIIVSLFIAVILGFLGAFFKAMSDRNDENTVKGVPEAFVLNASFKGLANVYDTKKRRIREQTYSSGGSGGGFSGGGFSSGGGGFSSGGGGGGGFSSGGHSF